MATAFSARDYKSFLKQRLASEEPFPVTQAAMARAAGCRPSYLSQCLNGKVHLLPEQAHSLAEFLRLGSDESEYFRLLVEHERSGTEVHRAHLRKKMAALKDAASRISNRISGDPGARPADRSLDAYYSSWIHLATHMLCTLPGIKGPRAVAERLGVGLRLAGESVRLLKELGLIEEIQGTLRSTNRHLSLTDSHPALNRHHSNWRMLASLRPQPAPTEDLHYTAVFSLSEKDSGIIREELAKALLRIRERVKASPEEKLFAFNVDWFGLT